MHHYEHGKHETYVIIIGLNDLTGDLYMYIVTRGWFGIFMIP